VTGCYIVAAVLLATLIRMALAPLVGLAVPFFTYLFVTILLAWYKGLWPAVLSLPLSAGLGWHFVLAAGAPGVSTSGRSKEVATLGFVLTNLIVSFVIDSQRRIMERAKAAERAAEMAATQLRHSNDELRRANHDLELFAYSASHDLREPLRTISLSAQILEKASLPQPAGVNFVEQILMAARHMESLLEDTLTYTSTACIDTEPLTAVESGRVLEQVLDGLKGAITESGAVVTSGQLPAIRMHTNRLSQVFQNLISNAIKYRGVEPPCIHIEAHSSEGFWIFSVSDNGIGIDTQFSDQIFGLFKRLHTQSAYQGSGMGLAICRRIVEQYGGRIWVAHSEVGKGSTFSFSVPG
jgi:light-regulated signal transduction histidine kinase (bacteriophytochrome)